MFHYVRSYCGTAVAVPYMGAFDYANSSIRCTPVRRPSRYAARW